MGQIRHQVGPKSLHLWPTTKEEKSYKNQMSVVGNGRGENSLCQSSDHNEAFWNLRDLIIKVWNQWTNLKQTSNLKNEKCNFPKDISSLIAIQRKLKIKKLEWPFWQYFPIMAGWKKMQPRGVSQ